MNQIIPAVHLVIMANVQRWRKTKGLPSQVPHFRNEPRIIKKPVIDIEATVKKHQS